MTIPERETSMKHQDDPVLLDAHAKKVDSTFPRTLLAPGFKYRCPAPWAPPDHAGQGGHPPQSHIRNCLGKQVCLPANLPS